MSNPEFIVKTMHGKKEILAVSTVEEQQVTSDNKLILVTFEREDLSLVGSVKPPLLFMRVGKLKSGLYARFRDNI